MTEPDPAQRRMSRTIKAYFSDADMHRRQLDWSEPEPEEPPEKPPARDGEPRRENPEPEGESAGDRER